MTDIEAVKILGLSNSFTREEEHSAYRELAKKYHPDYYDNAEESKKNELHQKMLEINAAHEYLKKKYFSDSGDMNKRVNVGYASSYSNNYNGNSTNNYYDEIELAIYKRETIERIKEKSNVINIQEYPEYAQTFLKKIVDVTDNTIFIIDKICRDKKDVNNQYKFFISFINEQLAKLLIEFCKINNLDNEFIRYRVKYDYSVSKFYEQLEIIKNQYGDRTKQLLDTINKETEKYQNYIGYDELKNNISELKEKTITAIGKDFNNEGVVHICIKNMHTTIKEIFADYFKDFLTRESKKYIDYVGYNEYIKIRIPGKIDLYTFYAKERNFDKTLKEDFIKKYNDEIENIFARSFSIIDNLKRIKQSFANVPDHLKNESYLNLYEELKIIEQRFNKKGDDISPNLDDIEKKLEKLLILNNNIDDLNKAYNILITNYHNRLSSINPVDYRAVQKVNEIFDAAIKIFPKIENQEVEIDTAVDILSKITFNNYNEDMTIIKSANKINIESGVYIKSPDYMKNTYYDESFFYLKEEDGDFIMYNVGLTTTKEVMPIDIIKKEFISLEEFLKKAEYIGKEYRAVTFNNLILYRLGQVYISKYSDRSSFIIRQGTNQNLNTPSDYSVYGGDYKDINELIDIIKKQVERSVNAYEAEEKRKNSNYKIK